VIRDGRRQISCPNEGKNGEKSILEFHGLCPDLIAVLGNLVHHVHEKFGGGVEFFGREDRYGFAELTLMHEGRG
jgi:hypothetical protein